MNQLIKFIICLLYTSSGDLNRAARQTHRIIPLDLDEQRYYLQYSPYVYYNEPVSYTHLDKTTTVKTAV